jgi:hypothetical protein
LSDNGEQLIQLCVSQPVSDLELQLWKTLTMTCSQAS